MDVINIINCHYLNRVCNIHAFLTFWRFTVPWWSHWKCWVHDLTYAWQLLAVFLQPWNELLVPLWTVIGGKVTQKWHHCWNPSSPLAGCAQRAMKPPSSRVQMVSGRILSQMLYSSYVLWLSHSSYFRFAVFIHLLPYVLTRSLGKAPILPPL